ncbi:hypothetical protein RTM1035_09289 [Roseovarius sp. TM1035]|nr:hypothetical protein RTM1035_09289 [Roseovarius sp. TM1035]
MEFGISAQPGGMILPGLSLIYTPIGAQFEVA